MLNRLFTTLFILCSFSSNVAAMNSDNPFAKNKSLDIGKDVSWSIDKENVLATKTANDDGGTYYHLRFDNKQLEFLMSSDANGLSPRSFSQLEVKNLKIDGKQAPLFDWCLNNQEKHNRFLQQGLSVKKNICVINNSTGRFIIRLNKDTLSALKDGRSLSIVLKPFRTPLELNYDISDFQEMFLALNAKDKPDESPVSAVANPVVSATPVPVVIPKVNKCWAKPPEKYKTIKSIAYPCEDTAKKIAAETGISKQVDQKKVAEKKLATEKAAEKEKQRKLAEDKKQQELAAKLKQEQLLQAEAAAIAASKVKQSEIGGEIAKKMIGMCDKYWSKGEHRCYCQKYIEHAPVEIQKNSTCG